VPSAVSGIAFLSGDQRAEQATPHLDAIAAAGLQPWELLRPGPAPGRIPWGVEKAQKVWLESCRGTGDRPPRTLRLRSRAQHQHRVGSPSGSYEPSVTTH
jgi:hypothetical protein